MAEDSTIEAMNAALEPRMAPGIEFLHAIEDLGLDPEALFWAWEADYNRMVLVLVTSFFDYAGPLKVSRALFKAYRAAALPKEIDPFFIRLHSPRQSICISFRNVLKPTINVDGRQVPVSEDAYFVFTDGLHVPVAGIIKRPGQKKGFAPQERKWARFASNIDKLAA